MSKTKPKFIIIDGNALLHRAWHALPPLSTKKGEIVNAVYGFALVLFKVLRELKPKYAAVAFDTPPPTFRHKEFKEYKAGRLKPPDELYQQIPRLKELLRAFNIPTYEKPGFEADDLIGTIIKKTQEGRGERRENIIVTGDLDTLQLVDNETKVYTLKRGITEGVVYDEKLVQERYGLKPSQLIDFKALRGDPSDNILGVKGIGEKGASELIKEFGNLEEIYKKIKNKKLKIKIKEKVRTLLLEHEKEAFLSKKLVTIVRDVPIHLDLRDCQIKSFDKERVTSLLQELEFKSLLRQIPAFLSPEPPYKQGSLLENFRAESKEIKLPKNYHLVDTPQEFGRFLNELKKQKVFVLDTETTALNPFRAELLGISFCWQMGEAYYIPVRGNHFSCHPERPQGAKDPVALPFSRGFLADARNDRRLKPILENPMIAKYGHNIKYDMEVLANYEVNLQGFSFDTMIASYLLNPGSRAHSLDTVVFTELGHEMIPIEALIGKKGKKQLSLSEVPLEKLAHYSCEDALWTFRLAKKLKGELEKKNLLKLFQEIEMPLVPVLAQMERNGVKIDTNFLRKMSQKIEGRGKNLEKEIFELAGVYFNINSPKQLKEILFSKLKILPRGIRRIKTGLSTAASELEKMRGKHPIIELIFEHRELSKLKSTYLDSLPRLVNPETGRLHTSFNQTVTATGRLSSSRPNLQNIPIRTELGRKIRQAFIAENGYKLLSADYSQIELRVIASLSRDKKMIEAFEKGEDIHIRTAAEIYRVKLEEVTREMRAVGKTINFAVIYGMGPLGLAESLGCSRDEAQAFIDQYFSFYLGIREYLDETKAIAQRLGYVETLLGRRRSLPEINSGVSQVRAAAERMAINMPVQGLAADIVKMAMIEISSKFKVQSSKLIKMILQVHDELIFEVQKDQVKEVAKVVKEIMEGVIKLKVPIEVELSYGDNWGELRKIKN